MDVVPPFRVAPRGRPVPHNPEANIFMEHDKLMAYTNQSFFATKHTSYGLESVAIFGGGDSHECERGILRA